MTILAQILRVVAAFLIGFGLSGAAVAQQDRNRNRADSDWRKTTGWAGYFNPPRSLRFRRRLKLRAARRANGAGNRAPRAIR